MSVGGWVTDSYIRHGFQLSLDFFSYFLVCDAGFWYICFLVVYYGIIIFVYSYISIHLYRGVCTVYGNKISVCSGYYRRYAAV